MGKVPGLLEVYVNINGLPTSNADVMLDTTLESFEALKGYAVHPAHVAVADGKVRPYTRPACAWTTRCKTLSVSHPLDSCSPFWLRHFPPTGGNRSRRGSFFACAVKFQKLALRESCQNRQVLTERVLSSYFIDKPAFLRIINIIMALAEKRRVRTVCA